MVRQSYETDVMKDSKFADAAGIKTRYLEAGEGEPLVLVHGSGFGEVESCAEDWEPVFSRFAQSFHVYAFDKIGQGFTDNPKSDGDYVIGSTVQHMRDIFKALGIESAHVAGHSRGAYTVCRFALEHPELVKTLVIVDSGTLMRESGSYYSELEEKAASYEEPRDRYRYLKEASSFETDHITEGWLDVMVEIANLEKSKEAAAKMGGGLLPGSGSLDSKSTAGLGYHFLEDLRTRRPETHDWIKSGGIKSPTLIVWGFNDPSAPLDPHGLNAMRLIFPHAPRTQMHILNEAGHYCYREQPEGFAAAVTGFIKSS